MTNSPTSPFKKILLLVCCSVSFILSNAQRGNERRGQSENRNRNSSANRDRGFSRLENRRNNDDRVRPNRSQVERHQRFEPATRNADRGRQYSSQPRYQPTPGRSVHAQRYAHTDRNFRDRHVRVAPAPRYSYHNNGYHQYYHAPVYNAYNPCWRYNYLPARRTVISSFPFAYQTIHYGGCGYRFYNGTFYRPYNSAFIVVAPPIGLSINILPFGYRRIYVRDNPYYYYNGTYYNDYNDGYRVVAPPMDAVVESIPPGYQTITVDGETYYQSDGVQYKPEVQDNGEIWYRVIKVA